ANAAVVIPIEESNITGFRAARVIKERCGFKDWENGMGYDYVYGDVPGHFIFEFTPSAADDVSLESLLSFTVKLPSDEGEARYYVLLAAVRERARLKEPCCIRLFATDGGDLFPNEEEDYSNTEWVVGASGYTYNLYYGQTLETFDPPSPESRARIRRQYKTRQDEFDDPDDFRNELQKELDAELASMEMERKRSLSLDSQDSAFLERGGGRTLRRKCSTEVRERSD
ncbi:hypothetical protein CPLU01_16147, partial [Colletotrichum plurivorum]